MLRRSSRATERARRRRQVAPAVLAIVSFAFAAGADGVDPSAEVVLEPEPTTTTLEATTTTAAPVTTTTTPEPITTTTTLAPAAPGPAAESVGAAGVVDIEDPVTNYTVTVVVTGSPPPSPSFLIDFTCGVITEQLTFNGAGSQQPALGQAVVAPVTCSIAVADNGGASSQSLSSSSTVVNPLQTDTTLTATFDFEALLAMQIAPASGPPGTVIAVDSVDDCPAGANIQVNVGLLDASSVLDQKTLSLGPGGGSWSTTLTVPAGTPVQNLEVDATCVELGTSTTGVVDGGEPGPVGFYQVELFAVTAPTQADDPPLVGGTTARAANAVVATPRLTG